MDFAMLPPEINSGRMYAGVGSGPMLAAGEAWDRLAAELHSAANSYHSVVSGLISGPWLGPSSASMAAAATSYAAWLTSTAAQAEETAGQAKAAAAAYEEAFASTVPPPQITANRTLLMRLVAKNLFGPIHHGDRGHRGPVRRDVGPGHRGDVQLRRFVGIRDRADTI